MTHPGVLKHLWIKVVALAGPRAVLFLRSSVGGYSVWGALCVGGGEGVVTGYFCVGYFGLVVSGHRCSDVMFFFVGVVGRAGTVLFVRFFYVYPEVVGKGVFDVLWRD